MNHGADVTVFSPVPIGNATRDEVARWIQAHTRGRWVVWHGHATGHYFAAPTTGPPVLVEAANPEELVGRIQQMDRSRLTATVAQRPVRESQHAVTLRYPSTRGDSMPQRTTSPGRRHLAPLGHRLPRQGMRGRLAGLGQALFGGLVVRG